MSGVGIIQTLKHQKYLPLHGWIGDTLTGALAGDAPALALEPAREGPGETLRVRFPDPLRTADQLASKHHEFYAKNLRRVAFRAMAPDGQVLFVPAAFSRAREFLDRYDVIYASGMPWSGLLAAAALKLRRGQPLVLGMRDPWIEPDGVRYQKARNRVEAALEGMALRAADAVVVTSDGLQTDLLMRRPWLAHRVHVVPNGYDEEDFASPPCSFGGRLDLVHTGKFYGTKGPIDLFEGIRRWLAAHPDRRAELRVRLIGPVRQRDREAARRAGLRDLVIFEGPTSHSEAIARSRGAWALVAIDYGPEQARTRVLAKSFEYMRSGRPILLLSSGGDTERILAPCPRAVIVRKEDPHAIAEALERLACSPARGEAFEPDAYTRGFARQFQAGRLAAILNEVHARARART